MCSGFLKPTSSDIITWLEPDNDVTEALSSLEDLTGLSPWLKYLPALPAVS